MLCCWCTSRNQIESNQSMSNKFNFYTRLPAIWIAYPNVHTHIVGRSVWHSVRPHTHFRNANKFRWVRTPRCYNVSMREKEWDLVRATRGCGEGGQGVGVWWKPNCVWWIFVYCQLSFHHIMCAIIFSLLLETLVTHTWCSAWWVHTCFQLYTFGLR